VLALAWSVGPTAVTKVLVVIESWTLAVYVEVDGQKAQTAIKLPLVVEYVVN
jgi:hypothetical protein